ncbi:MAG TPA: hypothetical protein VJA40_03110 [archaeon]|nr:hypothetical protein [archaeon]
MKKFTPVPRTEREKRKEAYSWVFLVVMIVSIFATSASFFFGSGVAPSDPVNAVIEGTQQDNSVNTSLKSFKASAEAFIESFGGEFVFQGQTSSFQKTSLDSLVSGVAGVKGLESQLQRQGGSVYYAGRVTLAPGADFGLVSSQLSESLSQDVSGLFFRRFALVSFPKPFLFVQEGDESVSFELTPENSTILVLPDAVTGSLVAVTCSGQIDPSPGLAERKVQGLECFQS